MSNPLTNDTVDAKSSGNSSANKPARITLGLLLLYLSFNYLTALLVNPPGMVSTALFIGTAKNLPLLLFVPFMLKQSYYKLYAWLCYLLILYFCWAVLNAFAPGREGIAGIIEGGIIVALFISSMFSTRWAGKPAK